MIGRASKAASINAKAHGSWCDGKANTSTACIRSATSRRYPVSRTASANPPRWAINRRRSARCPEPTHQNCTSCRCANTCGIAWNKSSQPFLTERCAKVPTTAVSTPAPPDERAAGLHEELQRLEYVFTRVPGEESVWSAPNRAHGLRSRISTEGIEVFPRTTSVEGAGAAWRLDLRTRGLARGERTFALALPTLSEDGPRLVLDHGPIREWVWNRALGIEQGWTLPERPDGEDDRHRDAGEDERVFGHGLTRLAFRRDAMHEASLKAASEVAICASCGVFPLGPLSRPARSARITRSPDETGLP